ncbi:MAG: hypothetical protein KGZ25_13345, partial [Planctomycetes bacterium]|nr:hypothetical protein [Planctomycetota bacterium]
VEITRAPDYLFADADYATTLRFQLLGLDGVDCKLSSVHADFLLPGSDKFAAQNLLARTVGVNNNSTLQTLAKYDPAENNYTYECYVPSGAYSKIQVPHDTSQQGQFVINVGVNGIEIHSDRDEGGRVPYFADISVPAADISVGKDIPPMKSLSPKSKINVKPTRVFQALKTFKYEEHYTLWDWTEWKVTKKAWKYTEQPTYTRTVHPSGDTYTTTLFGWANLYSAWHYSRADLELDSLCKLHTLVAAKNYGHREGAWMNISYGGKNGRDEDVPHERARHAALQDVLEPNETAMDYSKDNAHCRLVFFQGGVEIEESVYDQNEPKFKKPLLAAAETVVSIFLTSYGVPQAAGLTSVIFAAIDATGNDKTIDHGAQAQIDTFWRWERPVYDRKKDKVEVRGDWGPLRDRIWSEEQNTGKWKIGKGMDLDSGTSFFVFADLSTRVHETARSGGPPSNIHPTTARALLTENDDRQMIYRVWER